MKIDKSKIKSVLFITLSNIGDAILTTPVLSALLKELPEADIDVMASIRTVDLFRKNRFIREVIVYDKHSPIFEKVKFIKKLRHKRYDLVVDLKNSALGFLLGSLYRTPVLLKHSENISMKEKHLEKIKALGFDIGPAEFLIDIDEKSNIFADRIFSKIDNKNVVAISCGARSHIKRWPADNFIKLSKVIQDTYGYFLLFLGDAQDKKIVNQVTTELKNEYLDLSGKTSLIELAAVLKRCRFLICNDSAIMHMASAVKIPVIALFGPTDFIKYGPQDKESIIVYKDVNCRPCQKAQCIFKHECLKLIKPIDVLEKVDILSKKLKINKIKGDNI
jgi:lipopolysaccharide heptosyltransferase II